MMKQLPIPLSALVSSILIILVLSTAGCKQADKTKLDETAQKVERDVRNAFDTVKDKIASRSDSGSSASDSTQTQSYEVTLSDYSIDMENEIRAGNVEFKVSNHGRMDHNFEIAGNGVKKSFTPNLKPDETRIMDLKLKPGQYQVYCPVDNHRNKGMKLEIKVQ